MKEVLKITRDFPPRDIVELWAWIVTEENGGEGIAACEMSMQGARWMMPLVGADLERIKSLEPQARLVEQLSGRPVQLKRFTISELVE